MYRGRCVWGRHLQFYKQDPPPRSGSGLGGGQFLNWNIWWFGVRAQTCWRVREARALHPSRGWGDVAGCPPPRASGVLSENKTERTSHCDVYIKLAQIFILYSCANVVQTGCTYRQAVRTDSVYVQFVRTDSVYLQTGCTYRQAVRTDSVYVQFVRTDSVYLQTGCTCRQGVRADRVYVHTGRTHKKDKLHLDVAACVRVCVASGSRCVSTLCLQVSGPCVSHCVCRSVGPASHIVSAGQWALRLTLCLRVSGSCVSRCVCRSVGPASHLVSAGQWALRLTLCLRVSGRCVAPCVCRSVGPASHVVSAGQGSLHLKLCLQDSGRA